MPNRVPTAAWMQRRPVRRIEAHDDVAFGSREWPYAIPAVRHVLEQGLDLTAATVFVGENGSGKSTVLEALAEAYGLNVEGGTTAARHTTRRSESPLSGDLRLVRDPGAGKAGFYLRAETMHGLYTYLESIGSTGTLHDMSHGESFIEMIETRCFTDGGRPRPGLYLFDEAESALSFSSSLRVLATLRDMLTVQGVQIVLATHSPILAALPGARILQFNADGIAEAAWADLDLVINERYFLSDPQRFLRHLS